MEIDPMTTPDSPEPKGAYSQVIRAGDFLFVSGQGPIDPRTNEFSFGDIRHETSLVLKNLESILAGCGASPSHIVKCSVFLAEASDFQAMNEIYAAFFQGAPPARTTVQAALVEPGMKIEIDCIAYYPLSARQGE